MLRIAHLNAFDHTSLWDIFRPVAPNRAAPTVARSHLVVGEGLEPLAIMAGVDPECLRRMSVSVCQERARVAGVPDLPVGDLFSLGRTTRACPLCLKTAPWHRSWWMFRGAVACIEHSTLLIGRCPRCTAALTADGVVLDACSCGATVSAANVEEAPFALLEAQAALYQTIAGERDGFSRLGLTAPAYLHLFLRLRKTLLTGLVRGWIPDPDIAPYPYLPPVSDAKRSRRFHHIGLQEDACISGMLYRATSSSTLWADFILSCAGATMRVGRSRPAPSVLQIVKHLQRDVPDVFGKLPLPEQFDPTKFGIGARSWGASGSPTLLTETAPPPDTCPACGASHWVKNGFHIYGVKRQSYLCRSCGKRTTGRLQQRWRRIGECVAAGMSDAEVARALGVSRPTVWRWRQRNRR